jgi:hypothetical protein
LNGELRLYSILDISTSGLRIKGVAPAENGQPIELKIGGIALQAHIVRTTQTDFALRIEDTIEARKAMIRKVYGSRHNPSVSEVRTNKLIKAVLVRAFR